MPAGVAILPGGQQSLVGPVSLVPGGQTHLRVLVSKTMPLGQQGRLAVCSWTRDLAAERATKAKMRIVVLLID